MEHMGLGWKSEYTCLKYSNLYQDGDSFWVRKCCTGPTAVLLNPEPLLSLADLLL